MAGRKRLYTDEERRLRANAYQKRNNASYKCVKNNKNPDDKYYGKKKYMVEDRCREVSDKCLINAKTRLNNLLKQRLKSVKLCKDATDVFDISTAMIIINKELQSRGYTIRTGFKIEKAIEV